MIFCLIPSTVEFTAEIDFKGYEQLMFFPKASDFELKIKSPWQHSSFCGDILPTERDISENGFEASWVLGPSTMRRHPHSWVDASLTATSHAWDEYFGVTLKLPADTYVQVDRVTNYAFLVMAIVLIAFLIGEVLTKIWVHPFQYFFVGLSLVMFYLLLLALAEHMNFNLSYAISAIAISAMTTAYGRMIFAEKTSSAFVLGGIILLAYVMIFVLTRLEDYALLAGTVIMLVLLGVMMAFTGHLNRSTVPAELPKA